METLAEYYHRKAAEERRRLAVQLRREFWARKQQEAKDAENH